MLANAMKVLMHVLLVSVYLWVPIGLNIACRVGHTIKLYDSGVSSRWYMCILIRGTSR